jgi:hypothetical protein
MTTTTKSAPTLPNRLITLQALLSVALANNLPGPTSIHMLGNGILSLVLPSRQAAQAWCDFFGLPYRITPRHDELWQDKNYSWQGWNLSIHSHTDGTDR